MDEEEVDVNLFAPDQEVDIEPNGGDDQININSKVFLMIVQFK